ncbi:putative aspartic protease [Glycine soja]|uniref:Putative aspartic protease n=1 Tax=Glycine soja TaxID=3848 RepID=A0A445LRR0_GLYSO|nr:putative aspartic protease [Glycine soja]
MATPLVYTLVSLPFIFHFSLTTATITTSTINLVIKLIHHESSLSPYNSKDTIWDHYSHKILKQTFSNDYISNLVPSPRYVVFLMNFSIGEPPIPQLAVMDTGSSLTWVMCHPCSSCSQQSVPIFDPSKSSTYSNLSCSECNKCDVVNGECPYSVEYVGSGSSQGIYAREQLTLETIDESIIKVPSLIFGCGRKFSISSNGYPYQGINGVFGLGSGRLVLGDKANMQGDSTTLNVINGLYYVNLEAISIGGRKLDIDPTLFERSITDNNSGVIIDSGADHTWLTKYGFEVLSFEVENLLEGVLVLAQQDKHNPYTLCYSGVVSQDLSGFPLVTFHFAEGAVLDLDVTSMFIQTTENEFCMAMLPGNYFGDDYESFSSIGMLAQQNYNVGYDLNRMRVYFQRIDCELLDG